MYRLAKEALISGTVAALAMMPFGFFFRALGLRVGHYGPKFAALYLETFGPPTLFIQHIVIGWVSVLPLCLLPLHHLSRNSAITIGITYGVAYYIAINSLALPLYFGDELPWSLGVAVIAPSLVVHIAFGVAAAWFIRFMRLRRPGN